MKLIIYIVWFELEVRYCFSLDIAFIAHFVVVFNWFPTAAAPPPSRTVWAAPFLISIACYGYYRITVIH